MILAIRLDYPKGKIVRRAVDILKAGGVIAYPTDTVYGIGCSIFDKRALERIYLCKRMDRHKPLSFICESLKDISQYALVSNAAYKIMKRLVPGPYTFILNATRAVPRMMLTKRKTVGIRVPDNEVCLSLVRELGHPIVSTSASLFGGDPLSRSAEIEEVFKPYVDLVIDGGTLVSELSTVVDLTEDAPRILREGKGKQI
ncbi:MAG: threonylcarbamoyl-AMP synthase [Armatimonadetes bacterium]|nr:threonylcarbamoyl-AMP synthase [Armatimonadota bacterium]